MTRNRKNILAIVSTMFTLCICCSGVSLWLSWTMGQTINFTTDSLEARKIGAEIANYTPPSGYVEVMGIHFLENMFVILAESDFNQAEFTNEGVIIMLMKVPNADSLDRETLERELELGVQRQIKIQTNNLTLDHVETRVINGEAVTLTFRKGEDAEGGAYRQMSALTNSEYGAVFIVIQGPENDWNQATLDQFLESIH